MPNGSEPNNWLNSPILHQGLYASGRGRLAMHSLFWGFMFLFMLYTYKWLVNEASLIFILALSGTTIVLASYYFVAHYCLPLLYQKQWLRLLMLLVALYIVQTAYNYYSFLWVATHYNVFTKIADNLGGKGILHALTQSNTLLINWSFTLSSLTIPVALKIVKDILMARTKTAELERDNIRLELQFLQAQIQPHFVLNSINSVYSVVAGTDDEAATMLLRLSALLRYALHETANPTVSLAKEVEFLREYIGLEAVRQHERTTLSFQYEGSVEGYQIPPLLLVTFVENAFKHGINATYRQAWANVRLQIQEDGTLNFQVENSKPPLDVQQRNSKRTKGIGLENTRRRLNLLFPKRHQLTIKNDAETFTVNLTLNLERTTPASTETYLTQQNVIATLNGATHI